MAGCGPYSMQKGRKGHGKGKGKRTEFWAVSEAAFREMTEAPPSAGASPEGASALGSGGEVTKSEPDDPPGTGCGKGSEMKLEPVADPENAKEDMAAPAGLVPFFAPLQWATRRERSTCRTCETGCRAISR